MRISSSLGLFATLLLLTACNGREIEPPQAVEGAALVKEFLATNAALAPYQTGKSYTVNGITYEPAEDFSYTATGIASYYSNGLDGALTASGETYLASEYTAAHKTLPFQTLIRVTHLTSGETVIVRINDRGPFVEGRIIDLSGAAAASLGIIDEGLATVQVEVLEPETQIFRAALANGRVIPAARPPSTLSPSNESVTAPAGPIITTPVQETAQGGFFVLVGTYTSQSEANTIRDFILDIGTTSVEPSGELFSVFLGPLSSRLEAQAILARIFGKGFTNASVIQR